LALVPEGSSSQPPILVSACLLGIECNDRGSSNLSAAVVALGLGRRLVAVCPEVMGGLPTPRPAAEIQSDGRVLTSSGDDVTGAFRRGAAAAVELARATGAQEAILKARSPSCGCHGVYDGTFTRTPVAGEGVTAQALREEGLWLRSEEDVAASSQPPPP
jgi:uncharacterized protein YbbK (DUF523 family)